MDLNINIKWRKIMIPDNEYQSIPIAENKGMSNGAIALFVGIALLTLFLGFYYADVPRRDINEKDLSSEIIQKLEKTTTGDFIIFKNQKVGLVQLSGGIEDGSFYFLGSPYDNPDHYFGIGDWKNDIKEVVLKSDTLEWYKKAKEHLIP